MGAVCPECGPGAPSPPPDAIAREPGPVLWRVTSGLWMLCLTPCCLALIIVFFAVGFSMQLALVPILGAISTVLDAVMWGAIGVLMVAMFVSWTLGWWLAATPLQGHRANRMRCLVRRLAMLAGAAVAYITAEIAMQTAGLPFPTSGGAALLYGVTGLTSALALFGPFVLDDLGRRCEIESRRRHARWIRVLAFGVVLAFVVGVPLQLYLQSSSGAGSSPTGSAGGWSIVQFVGDVTEMTMIFGPLALLLLCAELAFMLYPGCAALCESRSGSPHWSTRGPLGGVLRFAGWFGGGQRRVRRRAT